MTKLGGSGKFPMGKMDETDEGELTLGVTSDPAHGTVVIAFGKPIAWIGIYPVQARALAASLIAHAEKLEKGAQ